MISVTHRGIKAGEGTMPMTLIVLLPDQAQIAKILFQQWFIEVVPGFKRPLNFGRSGVTLAIKGSARSSVNEQEGKKADDQEQRYSQEQALYEINGGHLSVISSNQLIAQCAMSTEARFRQVVQHLLTPEP